MKHSGNVDFARALRRNQTEVENMLWFKLRELQFDGIKFRRQHPLGNYIVDFVCIQHKLIIEVDGGQHNESKALAYDEERSAWLEKQGYRVLRFWDNDVSQNIDCVISQVFAMLANVHPHPSPQRKRELFRKP
jgi:very-short-patch-repair endonuclease